MVPYEPLQQGSICTGRVAINQLSEIVGFPHQRLGIAWRHLGIFGSRPVAATRNFVRFDAPASGKRGRDFSLTQRSRYPRHPGRSSCSFARCFGLLIIAFIIYLKAMRPFRPFSRGAGMWRQSSFCQRGKNLPYSGAFSCWDSGFPHNQTPACAP